MRFLTLKSLKISQYFSLKLRRIIQILIHIISNPDWITSAVRSEVFGLLTSVSVTPAHVCGGMKEPFYE